MEKSNLTIEHLLSEADTFAQDESSHYQPNLYGVTDGKAVGTYLEHKFKAFLEVKYQLLAGNSALGTDLPSLGVDIKVTSMVKPQSSCPFKSAKQKIFGLGYGLLVFVYKKSDYPESQTSNLDIQHVIYVDKEQTADFQMTTGLLSIINNEGNVDDLVAFMHDKNLPLDDVEANQIAEDLLNGKPLNVGYLTISNAHQWRLKYSRVIAKAGTVDGVTRVK